MKARTAFRLRKLYMYCNKIDHVTTTVTGAIAWFFEYIFMGISQLIILICLALFAPIIIPVELAKSILLRLAKNWENKLTKKQNRRYLELSRKCWRKEKTSTK